MGTPHLLHDISIHQRSIHIIRTKAKNCIIDHKNQKINSFVLHHKQTNRRLRHLMPAMNPIVIIANALPDNLRKLKKQTISKRPPVFPQRLHEMLDNAQHLGYSHIVSWMPDGTSFKIHDEMAAVDILKKYFKQTRLKSFFRQLQLYGFARTCKGPRRGECKHELFVRGKRDMTYLRAIDDFEVTPPALTTVVRRVSADSADLTFHKKSAAFEVEQSLNEDDGLLWSAIPTKLSNVINTRATASTTCRKTVVSNDDVAPEGDKRNMKVSTRIDDDHSSLHYIEGTRLLDEAEGLLNAGEEPSNWTDEYPMITAVRGDILSSMTVHPIEDSNLAFFEKHFIYDDPS